MSYHRARHRRRRAQLRHDLRWASAIIVGTAIGSGWAGYGLSAITDRPPRAALPAAVTVSSPPPPPSSPPTARAAPTATTTSLVPTGATSGPTDGTFVVTVEPGMTLSAIAAWFTTHGYGAIYRANRAVLGPNPNLIYAGERILVSPHLATMAVMPTAATP